MKFEVQTILEPLRSYPVTGFLGLLLLLVHATGISAFADDSTVRSVEQVAEQAKAAWDSGAVTVALELLDQGIHDHPHAPALHTLRGDILSTFRDQQSTHPLAIGVGTVEARSPGGITGILQTGSGTDTGVRRIFGWQKMTTNLRWAA